MPGGGSEGQNSGAAENPSGENGQTADAGHGNDSASGQENTGSVSDGNGSGDNMPAEGEGTGDNQGSQEGEGVSDTSSEQTADPVPADPAPAVTDSAADGSTVGDVSGNGTSAGASPSEKAAGAENKTVTNSGSAPTAEKEEQEQKEQEQKEQEQKEEKEDEEKEGEKENGTFSELYPCTVEESILSEMDFSSCRLLAGVNDPDVLTEDTEVLFEYRGIYLLVFPTKKAAKSAYTYYVDNPGVDFITPDYSLSADNTEGQEAASGEEAVSDQQASSSAVIIAPDVNLTDGDDKESAVIYAPGAEAVTASEETDQAVIIAPETDADHSSDNTSDHTAAARNGLTAKNNPLARLRAYLGDEEDDSADETEAVVNDSDTISMDGSGSSIPVQTPSNLPEPAQEEDDLDLFSVKALFSAASKKFMSILNIAQAEPEPEEEGNLVKVALIDTGVSSDFYEETPETVHHAYDFVADDEDGDYEEGYRPMAAHYKVTEAAFDAEMAEASVISRYSLIDENEETDGSGHGSSMARYILQENPKAEIVSIKALDADGKGNVSDVYAAILLAIEEQVSVINLSMSALDSTENAALRYAVEKAAESGILVVASAGNNASDASYFTPGNIDSVITIGAVDELGNQTGDTNFGESVDYYVWADSTSEAAARFTGIITNGAGFPDYAADLQRYLDYNTYVFKNAAGDGVSYWKNLNHDLTAASYTRQYEDPHLIIKKVDENGNPLEGAEFVFKMVKTLDGREINYDTGRTGTTNKDGILIYPENWWDGYGLEDGVYKLEETKAPDGYIADSTEYTIEVRENLSMIDAFQGSKVVVGTETDDTYKPTDDMVDSGNYDEYLNQRNYRTTNEGDTDISGPAPEDRPLESGSLTGVHVDIPDAEPDKAGTILSQHDFYVNSYSEWTDKQKEELRITIETNAHDVPFQDRKLYPIYPNPPTVPMPEKPVMPEKPTKPVVLLEPPLEPTPPAPPGGVTYKEVYKPVKGVRVVYAFTTCTAHDFSRSLAVRNFNWLKQFYDIVDVIVIDGHSVNSIRYYDDVQDINSFINKIKFDYNQHYAINIVKGLSTYLKTHSPDVIYTSFDRLVLGNADTAMNSADIENVFAQLKDYYERDLYISATGGYRYDRGTSALGWKMLWGLVDPTTWNGIGNTYTPTGPIDPIANYAEPFYIHDFGYSTEVIEEPVLSEDYNLLMAEYRRDVEIYNAKYALYLQSREEYARIAEEQGKTIEQVYQEALARYDAEVAAYNAECQRRTDEYNAALAAYKADQERYKQELAVYNQTSKEWQYRGSGRRWIFSTRVSDQIVITGATSQTEGVRVAVSGQYIYAAAGANYDPDKPVIITVDGLYRGAYDVWFQTLSQDVSTTYGIPQYNNDTHVATYDLRTITTGSPKLKIDFEREEMETFIHEGKVGLVVKNRKIKTYTFSLEKVDDEGNPLPGAEFTLSGTSNDGTDYELVRSGTDMTFVVQAGDTAVKQNGDTVAAGEGIKEGTYTLKETVVPEGYLPMPDRQVIIHEDLGVVIPGLERISADAEHRVYGFRAVNKPGNADLKIIKVDKNDDTQVLSGAKFTLTPNSEETSTGEGSSGETTTEETTVYTTGEDGSVLISGIKDGEYTLKEVEAPKDYNADNQTWAVSVIEGSIFINGIHYPNETGLATIQISNSKVENYPLKVIKVDSEDTIHPLKNAKFAVWKITDSFEQAKHYYTDENGLFHTDGSEAAEPEILSLDKNSIYLLKETKAPEGYLLDERERLIRWENDRILVDNVPLEETDVEDNTLPVYRFKDDHHVEFKVRKKWVDDKTNSDRPDPVYHIVGVTYDEATQKTTETSVLDITTWNDEDKYTNEWLATVSLLVSEVNKYSYLYMYEDPVPYNSSKYYTSTNGYANPLILEMDGTDTITNRMPDATGQLKIIKLGEDGGGGTIRLANAVFSVTGIEGDSIGQAYDAVTDTSGEALIQEMVPGKYRVSEVIAPDGYKLAESQEIVVEQNTPVEITISDKKNQKITFSIGKDWQTDNPLTRPASIKVKLLADGKPAKDVNGDPVPEAELTADAKGAWSYLFENLPEADAMGSKITYSVQETVPDGYRVKYIDRYEGWGYKDDHHVMIVNKKDPAKLFLTKVDGDTGERLAGATFRLTGTDGDTQDKVYEGTTDTKGLLSFMELIPGEYLLEEIEVPDNPRHPGDPKYCYIKMSPQTLTVTSDKTLYYTAENFEREDELPGTGGGGLSPLILLSLISLALMQVILAVKRRWGVV